MDNVSSVEVLVVLLVGLVVLGPTRLPQAVRQVGRFVGEIRRVGSGFAQELREAAEEPLRQSEATLAAADSYSADSRTIHERSDSTGAA